MGGSDIDPLAPFPAPAAPPTWSAILEVQDPDGTRTRHPFRHPRTRVGRARDNDLSLADDGVSHQHCEFVAEQGFLVVRDLGSQNGTWVNERRGPQARLRDGDVVRIGNTRIQIFLEGKVKRPARRLPWGALGVVLGILAAGATGLWLRQRQQELRASYAAALRAELGEACITAQPFDALEASEAQLAGRSFAFTLGKGGVQLSKEDAELDRALVQLYRQRAPLFAEAWRALALLQQQRRASMERLSLQGARLWTAQERKTAAYIDAVLQESAQAVDELLQSLEQLGEDTARLTAAVDALLGPQRDLRTAEQLKAFRFRADLRAARAACEEKSAHAAAGLSGALSALVE